MPGMGLGRVYGFTGGTQYSWLNGYSLRSAPDSGDAHLYQNRIPVMMHVVSSHCIHHLPEVRDDTFDITYQERLLSESIN